MEYIIPAATTDQYRPSIRADYDTEIQYVVKSYYVQDGKIYETYSVEEINDIPIDILEE